MPKLKIKGKIILPTISIIVILLVTIMTVAIMQYNSFMDYLMQQRLETAANGLREFAEDARRISIDLGLQVAADPRVISAVMAEDTPELMRVGQQLKAELPITFFTFMSVEGIALARTAQPDNFGDAIATPSLLAALQGEISVAYSPVQHWQIPIRSAVPIFYEGEIVGGVVTAYAIDDAATLAIMQERFDADFTIFVGEERIATTMIDPTGADIVGTTMTDPHILDVVFRQHREYTLTTEFFGRHYNGFYLPLVGPDGDIYATLFMGLSTDYIISQRNVVTLMVVAMAAIGLVVAIALMYFMVSRTISPLSKLSAIVSDISRGKLNVNSTNRSDDEIGMLTKDVCNLATAIKNMVDDLSNVHTEYIKLGHINYNIDETKYENSFKDMVVLVNGLLSSVTTDIEEIANILNLISDGDFSKDIDHDIWIGEWIFIPKTIANLTTNLKSVNTEVNAMIESVAERGDLSFEIKEEGYMGDWRKIMNGLNRIAKAVDTPITVLDMALSEMEKGNFDVSEMDRKIEAVGIKAGPNNYNGTFRKVLNTFDKSASSISSYINEIQQVLAQMADGDLRKNISREYVGSFDLIKSSVNNISSNLHKTMSEISLSAEQVLQGANQISSSATDLSSGAQDQASSVQELTATIDMISQQTLQNAESATTANELSGMSTINAKQGNEAMQQMVEAMAQIKESSNSISQIVKTIQDIAFQTNLLALNASVEAARAGEHGKGFAVVADEVRTLAGRSQEAATQTTSLIQDSISRVEAGNGIAEATAESLNAIVSSADEVLSVISSISAASKEQADAISNVSGGLTQISKVVQNNSAVSEETAAASEELNSQAEVLKQLVSFFKL